MRTLLVLVLGLALPTSVSAQVPTEFDGTEVLNPGFESIGFDLGDGLRSATSWDGPSALSARAFDGRDGVVTGSAGYLRTAHVALNSVSVPALSRSPRL
ncbi:MAG: hypothetical protein JRG76_14770 [Deltaproteobacteria bacterium]|nr:hypothetical protein [Deltaproteobacteria bacterium]MBW2415765.1 hypothetical protein [Deltaproteobacteria bacterium]